jgi:hypothetical protein
MKEQINNALLMNLGNRVIDEIKPKASGAAEVEELRLQLKALVQNKKILNLKNKELIESDRDSEDSDDEID